MKTRYIKHRGLYKPILVFIKQILYEIYTRLPWVQRKRAVQLYWTGNMVFSSKFLQGVIINED